LVLFELLEVKFESRHYALMAKKKLGGAKGKARGKPEYRTYYVEAPTEQEAIKKVKEKYIGDQVLMIAGKLSSNGFGLPAPLAQARVRLFFAGGVAPGEPLVLPGDDLVLDPTDGAAAIGKWNAFGKLAAFDQLLDRCAPKSGVSRQVPFSDYSKQ
jgi:hypothetical protein